MRLLAWSSLLALILTICSSPVSAQTITEVELKAIASTADSIPEQKPRFAADCQYAYAMMEAFAVEDDQLVRVRGGDEKALASAGFMKNVWGLVLYREAIRKGKDPKAVNVPLKREIEKREFINRMRMASGPFKKIEKQLRKCVKNASLEANE